MTNTVAKLICDGSLDGNDGSISTQKGTLLGGYAGGISVERGDEDYMDFYTASVPGLPNSSFVEIRAIEHGLFRLKEMQKKHDLQVNTLTIYTDSKRAVDNFNLLANDPDASGAFYKKPIGRLITRIRQLGIDNVNFEHVKAHVNNEIATPLERMHNVVDRAALSARWQAQTHAFDPDGVVESPFYGVVLDTKVNPEEAIKLKEFAYNMGMKGMIARVAFEGDRISADLRHHHPFMEGLELAAQEKGLSARELWNNCQQYSEDEMEYGVVGFDEVYVNHYYFSQGRAAPKAIKASQAGRNAGVAARLFMGQGIRQIFNERSNTGRLAPPSQAVFNFGSQRHHEAGDPFSVSGWTDTLSSMINMHHELSLDNAMRYAHRQGSAALTHEFSDVFALVDAVYDGMEPEQISAHLSGALEAKGYTVSSRLRERIAHHADAWVHSADKVSFCMAVKKDVVNLASTFPYFPHPDQVKSTPQSKPDNIKPAPRATLSLSR